MLMLNQFYLDIWPFIDFLENYDFYFLEKFTFKPKM